MNEDVVAEAPKAGTAAAKQAAAARPEGVTTLTAKRLSEISMTEEKSRILTGISELDRVLGGGIVLGGVVLLSGEPGVGKYKNATRLHWRQAILLIEIIILIAVGFMPHSMDMFATIIVSFSCAMQVQAFRKVNGYSYASTMCIGNLRSGTDALSVFVRTGNKTSLKKAGYYFGIILFFAIGAGIGGNLSMLFGIHTIWISSALLSISVLLMFAEKLKI